MLSEPYSGMLSLLESFGVLGLSLAPRLLLVGSLHLPYILSQAVIRNWNLMRQHGTPQPLPVPYQYRRLSYRTALMSPSLQRTPLPFSKCGTVGDRTQDGLIDIRGIPTGPSYS